MSLVKAYDTFADVPSGQSVSGVVWDSGDITWTNNGVNLRLKSDGGGYLIDQPAPNSTCAAAFTERAGDVGAAVYFLHSGNTEITCPRLFIFSNDVAPDYPYGIRMHVENGKINITEYPTDASAGATLVTVPIMLLKGSEYCLEICRTADPSNKVYNYRFSAAPGGVRAGLLVEGTFTANTVMPGPITSIRGASKTQAIDPIRRVESLATPFGLGEPGAGGAPTDDGTTITSLIGTAADCHFADFDTWWRFVPNDITAQARNHTALLDKSAEFVLTTPLKFNNKIANATYGFLVTARPGHAYYEDPRFLTGPLHYDATRGASITSGIGSSNIVSVQQDYMVIRGLQVQNKSGPGGSGCAITSERTNSSLQLCLFDVPFMSHTYAYIANIAGSGSKHFGNFFITSSNIAAINLATQAVQFENCTFISASDSGGVTTGVGALGGWDGTVMKNCAFFGWAKPFYGNAGAVKVTNCVSDTAHALIGNNNTYTNFKQDAVFAKQFMSTAKATLDLRTRAGSDLYNAGAAPSSWNNISVNGPRVRQGVADIGAYEADRFLPNNLVITGKSSNTTGFPVTLTISLDQALAGDENETVVLDDGAGGSFNPSSVTISASTPAPTVSYLAMGNTGPRVVTATQTAGSYPLTAASFNFQVTPPAPATALVVEQLNSIKLGESGTFVVSTDKPPFDAQQLHISVSSDLSCDFSPTSVTLTKDNTSATISFTPNVAGTMNFTLTENGDVSLPPLTVQEVIQPKPPTFVPGNNYYEVGIGHQFTNLAAFAAWVADKDLVAIQANMYVRIFSSERCTVSIRPLSSSDRYNIHYSAAAGLGYRDLATTGKFGYPDSGIEINVASGNLRFSNGSTVEDLRFRVDDDASIIFDYNPGNGTNSVASISVFQHNRVMVNRPTSTVDAVMSGERACSLHVRDNVFVATKPGRVLNVGDGSGDVTGNTVVATSIAVGNAGIVTGGYGGNVGKYQNNVFWNCGSSPWSMIENSPETSRITTKNYNNNFTNNTVDSANHPHQASGLVVNTTSAFFNDAANGDYRANKLGPLYGTATSLAVSTTDAAGQNRGYSPDVGALQLEPATTLGIVKATKQQMSGNRLYMEMSLQNVIDTLTVVVPPDIADPGGAVQMGPFNVTMLGAVGSVTIDGIPVGKYGKPILTAHNAGGDSLGTGFNPFSVDSIKTNAILSEFIGVADSVLAHGKPILPIFGAKQIDKNAISPLIVNLLADNAYVTANGSIKLTADINTKRLISKVEFYRDATMVFSKLGAPFEYTGEVFDSTKNGSYTYSIKVYDAYNNAPVTASAVVNVNIPPAGATTPTLLSVTAVDAVNDQDQPHLVLVFSEPMDTSKYYDFSGPSNVVLNRRLVAGTKWAQGSNTTLYLYADGMYPMLQGENMKLSYRKDPVLGWRSANGVLVESFYETVVVNNLTEKTSPFPQQNCSGLAANAMLYDVNISGLPAGTPENSIPLKPWTLGTTGWHHTTLFKTDANGHLIPADASSGPRINGGVLTMGNYQPDPNGPVYWQTALAVSFTLKTDNDSPYGIVLGSDNNSNTSFGNTYVRADISRAGLLTFQHGSANKIPNTYPTRQLAALDLNVEYTLRMCQTDDNSGNVYAVQLWKSTNGVLNTLVAMYTYHINEDIGGYAKIYTTNAVGPYATLQAINGPTWRFGGDRVNGDMVLGGPAVVKTNTGVNITNVPGSSNVTYTGGGRSTDDSQLVILDTLYAKDKDGDSSKISDSGAMFTVGNNVQNIRLGLSVSKTLGVVGDPVPAKDMFCAIKLPAIGSPYETYLGGTNRMPYKQLLVTSGDMVRIRTCNMETFMEVKQAGQEWAILTRVRFATRNRLVNYLTVQIILPGVSEVTKVMQ